ncbi:hypothetical protein Ga0061067_1083 [Pannonibacter indicus]|uniref:Uncharacterized protein n=1 Tax=Pannonibacter indicus TaxID=466044 RepID=A0A0K6I3B2_9HYPH|nr:hypothetical protein Ga0061067_1083 [Pannonibacter indicus]
MSVLGLEQDCGSKAQQPTVFRSCCSTWSMPCGQSGQGAGKRTGQAISTALPDCAPPSAHYGPCATHATAGELVLPAAHLRQFGQKREPAFRPYLLQGQERASQRHRFHRKSSGGCGAWPPGTAATNAKDRCGFPQRSQNHACKAGLPVTWRACAADPGPSFWPVPNVQQHSSEQPSGSRPAGPTSRGTLPGSCRSACAGDASAT